MYHLQFNKMFCHQYLRLITALRLSANVKLSVESINVVHVSVWIVFGVSSDSWNGPNVFQDPVGENAGVHGPTEDRKEKVPSPHLSQLVVLTNSETLYGLAQRVVATESLWVPSPRPAAAHSQSLFKQTRREMETSVEIDPPVSSLVSQGGVMQLRCNLHPRTSSDQVCVHCHQAVSPRLAFKGFHACLESSHLQKALLPLSCWDQLSSVIYSLRVWPKWSLPLFVFASQIGATVAPSNVIGSNNDRCWQPSDLCSNRPGAQIRLLQICWTCFYCLITTIFSFLGVKGSENKWLPKRNTEMSLVIPN